jgi:hypothetical protein
MMEKHKFWKPSMMEKRSRRNSTSLTRIQNRLRSLKPNEFKLSKIDYFP